MQELSHELLDLDDPHQHTKNIDTLSIPYPMEITHPPPKPYKLRPNRVPKHLKLERERYTLNIHNTITNTNWN
jgi:hypothetical protein